MVEEVFEAPVVRLNLQTELQATGTSYGVGR